MPTSAGFEALLRAALRQHALELSDGACTALVQWAELVARRGRKTNLVGALQPERIIDELIIDSLQALHIAKGGQPVVDVGAGAGIPGVMLCAATEQAGVMIEPRMKRAMFLKEVARATGLQLEVHEARLEDLGDDELRLSGHADVPHLWVSRAVFSPARWLEVVASRSRPGDSVCVWLNDRAQLSAEHLACAHSERTYRLAGGRERVVLAYEHSALGAWRAKR